MPGGGAGTGGEMSPPLLAPSLPRDQSLAWADFHSSAIMVRPALCKEPGEQE